ncbi:MAG: hypothetical protein AAB588_01810 [Patescibacteria group bacterium]
MSLKVEQMAERFGYLFGDDAQPDSIEEMLDARSDENYYARLLERIHPDNVLDPKTAMKVAKDLRGITRSSREQTHRNPRGFYRRMMAALPGNGGVHALQKLIAQRYGAGFLASLKMFMNFGVLKDLDSDFRTGELDEKSDTRLELQTTKRQIYSALDFPEEVYATDGGMPDRRSDRKMLREWMQASLPEEMSGTLMPNKEALLPFMAAAFPQEVRQAFLHAMDIIEGDITQQADGDDLEFFAQLRKIPWKLREFSYWLKYFDNCEKIIQERRKENNDMELLAPEISERQVLVPAGHRLCDPVMEKLIRLASENDTESILEAIRRKCSGKLPPIAESTSARGEAYFADNIMQYHENEAPLLRKIALMVLLMDKGLRNFMRRNPGATKYGAFYSVAGSDVRTYHFSDGQTRNTLATIHTDQPGATIITPGIIFTISGHYHHQRRHDERETKAP